MAGDKQGVTRTGSVTLVCEDVICQIVRQSLSGQICTINRINQHSMIVNTLSYFKLMYLKSIPFHLILNKLYLDWIPNNIQFLHKEMWNGF